MSLAALDAKDLDTFVKVCGLLGSDQDGERSAAAYKATEILRRYKLTWKIVLDSIRKPSAPPPPPPSGLEHREIAKRLLDALGRSLNQWEMDFLNSLTGWYRPLTEKRENKLNQIMRKHELI